MRFPLLTLLLSILLLSCNRLDDRYQSEWQSSPDGSWAGPGLWANRLQDWVVNDGKLVCINTRPMRTVHLTDRVITEKEGIINASVQISLNNDSKHEEGSSAGMLIGAGSGMDYRAAAMIHHSWGPLGGLFIGLDNNSNLFIRDFEKEDAYLKHNHANSAPWSNVYLLIRISPAGGKYRMKVTAVDPATNLIIDRLETEEIPEDRLTGNIALVSNSGSRGTGSTAAFSYSDWKVSGSKMKFIPGNNIGPIAGVQYTLSREILKMTVQMFPVGEEESRSVELELLQDGTWKKAESAAIEDYSFTAPFRITGWTREDDVEYRVRYQVNRKKMHEYFQYGIIKHDPVEKDSLTMLSLSCIKQVLGRGIDAGSFLWDRSMLYPHTMLTDNLKRFNADILFFSGDQVYEGSSPTVADTGPLANLDYLYKWIMWCQTYRDLTSTIPTITIPDDHDVYHGNLWGEGGKATPEGTSGAQAQDAGGYKMPPKFVNMVQATQTSHLPDPVDPEAAEQGIGVYFTECNVGGLSLAVIEDRKFKSAPRDLLPEADIFNGWPRNLEWNGKRNSRIEATLLGERQLAFLEEWAGDWSHQSWMKAVLSQTLFANLGTIPKEAANDNIVQGSELPDSGIYLRTDRLVTDFDSDGWPQVGRNRAISLFRKAFATHIAGDQHLGSTLQYGIDEPGDAGFAIISPATVNLWARRWHPPAEGRNRKEGWPGFLGDFEDGFGNFITVHAVANPHRSTVEPVEHNSYSTGYSSIVFHRDTRKIDLYNWPYYAGTGNGKPYPFWPVKINQLDNYGRRATQWLPEITVTGMNNPVVRIYRDITGEMIYAIRINGTSFQPKVFSFGSYTIEVGEPDTGEWKRIEGIFATSYRERAPAEVVF